VKSITLRPEVSAALGEWNRARYGRGVHSEGVITDPEAIERLERLSLPGEDLNDTIMRIIASGGAGVMIH
jgi:hypothetical protein